MSWFRRKREEQPGVNVPDLTLAHTGLAACCDHGVGMLDECDDCTVGNLARDAEALRGDQGQIGGDFDRAIRRLLEGER